ncbi:MAG: 30S ribosomal protein S16 [Saprospiraceae bacterium]|nr:30S ribosomal protein S16 [Saprospiraceae bacterium]
MSLKIRLQRKGRKKKPFYQIVAADARAPRDGKFIEKLGIYNPLTNPATIELNSDAAYSWLMKGAQPTDTVRAILKLKGIYYRKHLQRGVTKGALDQETADKLLSEWLAAKSAKIEKRKDETKREIEARRKKIFGTAPVKVIKEPEAEEAATEEVTEEAAAEEVTEEAAAEEVTEEAAAEEVTEEAAAEEVTEEAAAEEVTEEAAAEEVTEEAAAEEE